HATTAANGGAAIDVPEGGAAGRLIMFGGRDNSTTLQNKMVLIAPGDSEVVSPFTTVLVNLLDNHGIDVAAGSAEIREVFGLDSPFNLLTDSYLLNTLNGSEPAARGFRGDVKIASLTGLVSGSLAGLPNAQGAFPTQETLGLFFCSALADAVHTAAQNDQQLDLANKATVLTLIQATASRAGINLTNSTVAANVDAAAGVAAGVIGRIDAVTPAGSAAYMTAIVKVQKLATGAIPEQFAAVNAGTATSAAVAAAFSGSALDTLIAAQVVGNLSAPRISISDPIVSIAPDGSRWMDFDVSVAGQSSSLLPLEFSYTTKDSTATVADGDYVATSGTLVWEPGDTSTKRISVHVFSGHTPTPSQIFIVDGTATNAIVEDIGFGQIDLASLSTSAGLAVRSESAAPRNITVLEATILSAESGGVPATGSVTFYDGSTELGTVDLDLAGKAVWQSDLFLAGSHTFRAVYSGGTSQGYTFAASTSADQVVTVGTPQTISVDPMANRVWGVDDTTVQVMAGSSSGMPVSYSITGPATIDADGLVTTTGLGHVVVTVTQAGDAYTTAATPVVVSFDVARPTITIRIDSQSTDYGDDLSALGLTSTLSGFLGNDSSASLAGLPVLSIAPGAVHPGTYAIGATTAADRKYDFQVEAGTLTIRKALLKVTIEDHAVGYGASLPTLTSTIAGFVNGDTAAVLDALPQLATTAAGSNAGSYDITAADVEDNDYEIVVVPGTLTITPAALTITANDQAITYGDALPTFTVRYSGFVNGDTAASLDTAANVAVSAANFHAGSYGLTAADASDPNYAISFVAGTLTVAKAPLTITAASLSQVAGRALPALTALYTGLVNGETAAVLTAQPHLSTASTGSVGTAAIGVSGAASDDYQISYQAGTLTVVADSPSFAVLSSIANPLAGNTPTYTVTILSAIDGQAITAGTVQFRIDSVDQGSPVSLDSNGSASFTAAPLAAGSHTITAVSSGATGINAGTQSLVQSVGQYAATTGFVNATLAATYGGTPTYTVRVTPTNVANGTPAGTVQFVVDGVDSGAPVAVDGNGEATSPALAVLGAGTHTVLARFTSSNGFQSGADSVVLTVARKTIAITGLSGVNRAYNGTTAATVAGTAVYNGLVTAESFAVVGTGTATFADANVGVGKTVTVTGYEAPSDNYLLAASPTVTATILAKTIGITGLTGVNKTYDGTTAATVTGTATYSGLVNGESFAIVGSGTATFADSSAGTGKTVTITGLSSPNGNYILAADPTITANILPALLTVAAQAVTKTYDGVAAGGFSSTITGFVAGENAGVLSGAAAFTGTATTAVNAGVYRVLPATGTLAAQNYTFAFADAAVTILRRALSANLVNVPSKVYDGKVAATLAPSNVALSGMVGSESFTVTIAAIAATYASRNAAPSVAISVNLTGAGLVAGAGTLAANYETLVASGTGVITTRVLTVTPIGISKTYDSTTDSAVLLTDNRVGGDVLNLSYTTAAFVDKNVGYKSVLVGGIAVTGASAANYTVASTARTAASITPRLLAGTVTVADRVYDGTRTATIATRLLTGAIQGDVVTLAGDAATFADKAAGSSRLVTVTGLSLTGAQAGNYEVNTSTTARATITRRALVVTATAVDKIFDGTTAATVVLADDRVTGDTVTVSHTSATFATAAVGDGKTVTVSGITISGVDAANYTVATTTTTTAKIGSQVMAPVITAQPANVSILPGQSATFTATAGGTGVTVQWQRSTDSGVTWADIASARSTTYSVTVALADNGTRVRAVFTNDGGSVTSSAATVTVSKATVGSAGVMWGTSGTSSLVDAAASGGVVRLLPTGRVNDIPWANINRVTFTLDRAITDLSGVT
ncbi:MAG: MBG domain-containing protein, partial [Planctomycetia bacterium]